MKPKITTTVLCILAVFATVATPVLATAPYVTPILLIDDTNPSQTTITATDYGSFGTVLGGADLGYTTADGIDLLNFFTPQGVGGETFDLSGNLNPYLTGPSFYNAGAVDDYTGDFQDLKLYSTDANSGAPENFSSGDNPAFKGTSTIDLGPYADIIPRNIGTIGSIFVGTPSNFYNGGLIYLGDYEIVPEPSTWGMLWGGLLLLIFGARCKKSVWLTFRIGS